MTDTKPDRTLLVDGDVLAFTAAAAAQEVQRDFNSGWLVQAANTTAGEVIVENILLGLLDGLKASHVKLFLSDRTKNWRKEVYPGYKSNRVGSVRPLLLDYLKDYIEAKFEAVIEPELEADDLLGLYATNPDLLGDVGEFIIVSSDKDLRTIPGLHHRMGKRGPKGEFEIFDVSRAEAARFHMVQTLSGDAVDGYPGCPNVGKERALKIVAEPKLLVPTKGVKTVGVNKGQSTTKWISKDTDSLWGAVESNYHKAGLTTEDALVQARISRILRDGDYDFTTKELRLWTPDLLEADLKT